MLTEPTPPAAPSSNRFGRPQLRGELLKTRNIGAASISELNDELDILLDELPGATGTASDVELNPTFIERVVAPTNQSAQLACLHPGPPQQ